jgi:hypothetical protein
MLVRHHRLAIAGVVTATAIAVPAAAFASGSGSPSSKPAPPQASAASASESAAAASKFAAAASKSAAAGSQLTVPAPVRAFATRLSVGTSAAGRALKQIAALNSRQHGVDPAGAAFAAIAHDLGVSPARLAAAWDGVKQSVAGK